MIHPKEAKRQQKAPAQTDHAVRPPSGKSAGAIPGGGLNGGGPGAEAGADAFSGSGIFSFSFSDEEEEPRAPEGVMLPFIIGAAGPFCVAIVAAHKTSSQA